MLLCCDAGVVLLGPMGERVGVVGAVALLVGSGGVRKVQLALGMGERSYIPFEATRWLILMFSGSSSSRRICMCFAEY
jgi:hypothetical protein